MQASRRSQAPAAPAARAARGEQRTAEDIQRSRGNPAAVHVQTPGGRYTLRAGETIAEAQRDIRALGGGAVSSDRFG